MTWRTDKKCRPRGPGITAAHARLKNRPVICGALALQPLATTNRDKASRQFAPIASRALAHASLRSFLLLIADCREFPALVGKQSFDLATAADFEVVLQQCGKSCDVLFDDPAIGARAVGHYP